MMNKKKRDLNAENKASGLFGGIAYEDQ